MSTIEEAITRRLKEAGDVVAIVGAQVYPGMAPQSASPPFVVYELNDSEQASSADGLHGQADSEFDFICIGTSYGEAARLSAAVSLALTDWRDLGEDPPVHSSLTQRIVDGAVASPTNGDRRTYRRDVTIEFDHGVEELATPGNS